MIIPTKHLICPCSNDTSPIPPNLYLWRIGQSLPKKVWIKFFDPHNTDTSLLLAESLTIPNQSFAPLIMTLLTFHQQSHDTHAIMFTTNFVIPT